jgi:hypothetical protein
MIQPARLLLLFLKKTYITPDVPAYWLGKNESAYLKDQGPRAKGKGIRAECHPFHLCFTSLPTSLPDGLLIEVVDTAKSSCAL